MKLRFVSAIGGVLLAGLIAAAAAQSGDNPATPGTPGAEGARRHGPPPEAVAACEGKSVGAACSFANRRNETRTGTCEAGRRRGAAAGQSPAPAAAAAAQPPLACRPARSGQQG